MRCHVNYALAYQLLAVVWDKTMSPGVQNSFWLQSGTASGARLCLCTWLAVCDAVLGKRYRQATAEPTVCPLSRLLVLITTKTQQIAVLHSPRVLPQKRPGTKTVVGARISRRTYWAREWAHKLVGALSGRASGRTKLVGALSGRASSMFRLSR